MNNLGEVLRNQGNYAEAKKFFEKTLAVSQRTYGENHPNTLVSLQNLGAVALSEGNVGEAERI